MLSKLKIFLFRPYYFLKRKIKPDLKAVKGSIISSILSVEEETKEIEFIQSEYPKIIDHLKGKEILNVCFFMLNISTWKYDELYKKMSNSDCFSVTVVVIPIVYFGEENCVKELKISKEYCESKNYNYITPFKGGEWQDVKEMLKPDLVFFSNPNPISNSFYHIDHYTDILTVYVPYSIRIDNLNEYSYDDVFVNKIWRNYFETNMHKQHSEIYSRLKGSNVKVAGHPIIDSYRINKAKRGTAWKKNSRNKKKIIWAPHWTIKGYQKSGLDWAAFLDYSQFMLEMAEKYENEVVFAFKPHPFLKSILSLPELWGKDKALEYYKFWRKSSNLQLEEGGYIDLFIASDGLIHDSGSFAIEYLELNKPILYTRSRDDVENTFNDLGKEALKCHYMGKSKADIDQFISDVVNEKNDYMLDNRLKFKKKHLDNKGVSSSDFIINDLVDTLF